MKAIKKRIDPLSPRQLRVCLDITAEQRNKARTEVTKLRGQNHRLQEQIEALEERAEAAEAKLQKIEGLPEKLRVRARNLVQERAYEIGSDTTLEDVADEIEATLTEPTCAAPRQSNNQWQPIESAPKDGTRIMIWNALNGWPRPEMYVMSYWWEGGLVEGKQWDAGWWSCSWGYIANPTHWMPLPEPPKS